MKKYQKFLIAGLAGLSLIGTSATTIQASSLKNDEVDKDVVLFQNVGGKFDDGANFILIECKSKKDAKEELAEIEQTMASSSGVIDFDNESGVKNIYLCAANDTFSDNTNKAQLIKENDGNKTKLSKKTAFINLRQVIFAE